MAAVQYLEGLARFKAMKSLNSGGVVAFIMPSFLLSCGRLKSGHERDTGGLLSRDNYTPIRLPRQQKPYTKTRKTVHIIIMSHDN